MKKEKLFIIMLSVLFIIIITFFVCNKPNIDIIGKKEITISVDEQYKDKGAKVYNFFGGIKKLNIESNVNYKKIGRYKVTYSCKFLNTTIKKHRIVNVVDKIKPSINLIGGNEINIYLGESYKESGYVAKDNHDNKVKVIIVNNIDKFKLGTYNVDYIAIDKSNNKTIVSRKVHVIKPINVARKIYLTFDDGPNDKYTTIILDILKKENIKATFFVTMKGSDWILKREFEEGHSIGLHTAYHQYNYIYSSVDNYFKDLNIVSNRVQIITGMKSNIIRFPGGSSNTVSKRYSKGIMTSLSHEVLKRGYHYYDWNVNSDDAGRARSSTDVYNNVVNNLNPDIDNVVLMHDVNAYTAGALKNIIQYAKNKGYRFEKIIYDTKMITHKINN